MLKQRKLQRFTSNVSVVYRPRIFSLFERDGINIDIFFTSFENVTNSILFTHIKPWFIPTHLTTDRLRDWRCLIIDTLEPVR